MMAYMNEESFQATYLASRQDDLFQQSRQKLWLAGETRRSFPVCKIPEDWLAYDTILAAVTGGSCLPYRKPLLFLYHAGGEGI